MTTSRNNTPRNPGRPSRRPNIEFSDRDFDRRVTPPQAKGLRNAPHYEDFDDQYYPEDDHIDYYPGESEEYYPEDEHYDDRYDTEGYPADDYHDGRYADDGYADEQNAAQHYQRREQPVTPRQAAYPRHQDPAERDGYRAGYRDGFRDNAGYRGNDNDNSRSNYHDNMDQTPKKTFRKRHPILMNLLYAIAATFLAIWLAIWFLDFWTFHGQERAVPDVKGQSLEMAQGNISRAGLKGIVTDSIYDNYARPGTVIEQTPIPLAKIKRGGTVYLTIVAYTPKMVTIPDFYDVSERQARSMLEGLGITQVRTVGVPSEYAGLVLGAKFNGVSLRPGAKVPVTAVITLEVGQGYGDTGGYLTDEITDTTAIEQAIETLDIE